VAGFNETDTARSGSLNGGEFPDHLSDCKLLSGKHTVARRLGVPRSHSKRSSSEGRMWI
jgi:hypothetical protein